MRIRVAINGFGRIGRNLLRCALDCPEIEFVAVNGRSTAGSIAHLIKYDSILGPIQSPVSSTDDTVKIGTTVLRVFNVKEPGDVPWTDVDADVVVEASGHFCDARRARAHLRGSVKKVIITAPATNEDLTLVIGVNDHLYNPSAHHVISNASCTTNCLAPMAMVLHKKFGIKSGLVTTIHSYTNDQVLLDKSHKDRRRARAAALSMIPTSTGAAKALKLVLPELTGRLDGFAVRVPTPCVSLVDLTFSADQALRAEDVNEALRDASEGNLAGILGYTTEELVSVDFRQNACSSVVDSKLTKAIGHTAKVIGWYDNEWGYASRVRDTILMMGRKGLSAFPSHTKEFWNGNS